jgi:hypothetical protein
MLLIVTLPGKCLQKLPLLPPLPPKFPYSYLSASL